MTETFYDVLRRQGISRRSFLKFCSLTAASLGLGPEFAPTMAHALETKPRTPVLWLHGLECTCCSEAFIRSAHPLASDVILSMLSLDYDDTIMAAAGHQAEAIVDEIVEKYKGNYILAVRGQPAAQRRRDVLHHRRQAFLDQLKIGRRRTARRSSRGASCASWGCVQAARPNPTQAVPVHKVIHDKPIIKVPGCPPIPEVMTAVITYIADLREAPRARPPGAAEDVLFAAHPRQVLPPSAFRRRPVRRAWDDDGARKGYCLYKMGCKGPTTYNACSTDALERRPVVPDPVGPRLHRLLGGRLLGQRLVLQPPHQHQSVRRRGQRRQGRRHRRRRRSARPSAAHAAVSAIKRARDKGGNDTNERFRRRTASLSTPAASASSSIR